jgi:hypothetical protein
MLLSNPVYYTEEAVYRYLFNMTKIVNEMAEKVTAYSKAEDKQQVIAELFPAYKGVSCTLYNRECAFLRTDCLNLDKFFSGNVAENLKREDMDFINKVQLNFIKED